MKTHFKQLSKPNTGKHKRLIFLANSKNITERAKDVNLAVCGFHNPGKNSSTMSEMVKDGLIDSGRNGYSITLFGLSEVGRLEDIRLKELSRFVEKRLEIDIVEKVEKLNKNQIFILEIIKSGDILISKLINEIGIVTFNKEIKDLLKLGLVEFDGQIFCLGTSYNKFEKIIPTFSNLTLIDNKELDEKLAYLNKIEKEVQDLRNDINYFNYRLKNQSCFRLSKLEIETFERTLKILKNTLKTYPSHLQSVEKIIEEKEILISCSS